MQDIAQKYGSLMATITQLALIVWWASTINLSVSNLNITVTKNMEIISLIKERTLVLDERVSNLMTKVDRQEHLLEALNARIQTRR